MTQKTLAEFTDDAADTDPMLEYRMSERSESVDHEPLLPDTVLEWANRFQLDRREEIPVAELHRNVFWSVARSRGLDMKGWEEADYHGRNADYHRDDRMDPEPDCDAKAHAYAETHLR